MTLHDWCQDYGLTEQQTSKQEISDLLAAAESDLQNAHIEGRCYILN